MRRNRRVSSLCEAAFLVENCPAPTTSSVGSCHFYSSWSRDAREQWLHHIARRADKRRDLGRSPWPTEWNSLWNSTRSAWSQCSKAFCHSPSLLSSSKDAGRKLRADRPWCRTPTHRPFLSILSYLATQEPCKWLFQPFRWALNASFTQHWDQSQRSWLQSSRRPPSRAKCSLA